MLEEVDDQILHVLFIKIGPKGTANMACLNKSFNVRASDDDLWSEFCLRDLHLSTPLDPKGNITPSYKAAYGLWYRAFGMYPWELVGRVKRCWDKLNNWLTTNFPEAASTMRLHGVSEAEIDEVEEVLGVKFPVSIRILYRICDGQDMRGQLRPAALDGSPLGLIGGYRFSGHHVNVYLLPLHEVTMKTRNLRRNVKEFAKQWGNKLVMVAASSTSTWKYIFLDCTDGQLYAATGRFSQVVEGEELRMIPCVPQHENQQQEAMVAWLEEHGRRLEEGVIGLAEEVLFDGRRCISLYPADDGGDPTLCTTAVTADGVKVCGSAVFAPELADFRGGDDEFVFGYSIRMWFLPEGKLLSGVKKLSSKCELHWRRVITRAEDGALVFDNNSKPGMHKLRVRSGPGETKHFYYNCNTTIPTTSGSLEGYFTLRFEEANGGIPFDVEVPRFPLKVPDYVF